MKWRGSGFLFRFLINTVVQGVLLSICTECRGSFTPFSVRLDLQLVCNHSFVCRNILEQQYIHYYSW